MFPLINLCHEKLGAKIYCEGTSFSDGHKIENLIQNDKGYLASSFVKTPLDITISFNYPIDLERIGIKCKVGTCISDTISVYISNESMDSVLSKMNILLKGRDSEMKNLPSHNTHHNSLLSPRTLTIPVDNTVGLNNILSSNFINNNNNIINNYNSNNNNINVKHLTKSQILYDNIHLSVPNFNENSLNNKTAQLKYIHQQFKFIGSVDSLHSQDDLYTYICNSSFNYRGQTLPNSFLSKIQKQEQLKPFHSNSDLLIGVKSIRIRILKVYQSSCAALGGFEIWGVPSQNCPQEVLNQLYQNYQQLQQLQQQQSYNNSMKSNLFQNNIFSNNNTSNMSSNNMNGGNGSANVQTVNLFPKLPSGHQPKDEMKVEEKYHKPSIIDEFEAFLRDHPGIVLNETGIPTIFIDPITLEMMTDPVILKSGHNVDRSTIEKHFRNGFFTDPYTSVKMSPDEIQTNYVLKEKIQTFIRVEKKKRKRLLKSHSMIFRNQIAANMQPQISSSTSSFITMDFTDSIGSNGSTTSDHVTKGMNTINLFDDQDYHHRHNNNNTSNSNSSSKHNSGNNWPIIPDFSSLASSTSSIGSMNSSGSEIPLHNNGLLNPSMINFDNLNLLKKNPNQYTLEKMPSQNSFVELPIKKHRK
ncbi:RING zinc finger-containing protein [Tieghemostelium lacteum]|uniref:RING zinc finger-containing protein n=1 Tax=Tieghemostelium lacteum TaxID=361077 RepID=A0A152A5J3_TIELA|nr:RING zinc finger-containing protein [Tieghemostelium lacteum]|eukprot:KYR01503.1 RING zinc finger-containing protein [Tieghemostelium lacteum]